MRELQQACPHISIRGMNLEPYSEQWTEGRYLYGNAAERLPLPDESIDFIYTIVAMYFFEDRARFIEECHRVLRPGGQMRCTFHPRLGRFGNEYDNTDAIEGLSGIETLHDLLLSLPHHRVTTESAEIAEVTVLHKDAGTQPLRLGLTPIVEKRLDYGELAGDSAEGFLRNCYRFSPDDCTALSAT